IEKLRAANVDKIVSEKVSGVSLEREKLDDLLNMLVKGDMLVIARMDRLGRNTKQLLELVEPSEKKCFHYLFKHKKPPVTTFF
ncbi:recombinase family protein, partial [Vagococcus lutrae]|uniref:recombinase family protein n=1 Tax=Vagococcus lutrae TaxID=81947 RepID=UPI00288E3EF2